jgi:predicted phage tail protein
MAPGAGFAFGAKGVGFVSTAAAGGFSATALVGNVGVMLLLSGVAGLLTPTPTTPKSEEDPQNQFSFSGIQQVSRAGTAIPICYGEVFTGSVVISAEIDVAEQV